MTATSAVDQKAAEIDGIKVEAIAGRVRLEVQVGGVRLSAWLPDGPPAIKVLSPSDCRDLAVRLICAAGEVRR